MTVLLEYIKMHTNNNCGECSIRVYRSLFIFVTGFTIYTHETYKIIKYFTMLKMSFWLNNLMHAHLLGIATLNYQKTCRNPFGRLRPIMLKNLPIMLLSIAQKIAHYAQNYAHV